MERYIMFLDWKNQYCENDSTTQSNLQIQCNPYQITSGIFHRTRSMINASLWFSPLGFWVDFYSHKKVILLFDMAESQSFLLFVLLLKLPSKYV